MPRKANRDQKKKRSNPAPETIKIPLAFEKAIEGLLSVKPKKKTTKKKPSE